MVFQERDRSWRNPPLAGEQQASLLFVLEGAIPSSLKVLAADPALRNGQINSCQGHTLLARPGSLVIV